MTKLHLYHLQSNGPDSPVSDSIVGPFLLSVVFENICELQQQVIVIAPLVPLAEEVVGVHTYLQNWQKLSEIVKWDISEPFFIIYTSEKSVIL